VAVHARVVGVLQGYCVTVGADDIAQFLLGHPVLHIDSLQAAPWAAVPMCAWLAVHTVVCPQIAESHELSLQAVLLQRAELRMHRIAGDAAECARKTALLRDKLCTIDATIWTKQLPAAATILSGLRSQNPSESSLAGLLGLSEWSAIQALTNLFLDSLQPDTKGEQYAEDQSLFVLDGVADNTPEQWDGSEDLCDQVLLLSLNDMIVICCLQ
jgi:hypothetical protein